MMDTSQKFIKMCEKATEIQKEWDPTVGDYVWRKYTIFGEEIDRKIWPKKEQSEEIIILHYKSSVNGYFHAVDSTTGQVRIFNSQKEIEKITCIFLPRQDQLQEMIDWSGFSYIVSMQCYKIDAFYRTLNYFPDSMEQLWLAFVMHKKHGKRWDGEKWIKEG